MYCRVLACDFDGTGAVGGRLAPEVEDVLARARAAGYATLLVTGRVIESLRLDAADLHAFDAVVAENGAVVWFPATGCTLPLAAAPSEAFLGRLRAAGIAFEAGAVVVGMWEQHAADALRLVREAGLDLQLVFNRAAVMLLPSGVNKAVGVRRALDELRRSPRNMIAFGDAENDLPLLALAELGVAARGSVPSVLAAADDRLSQPGPAGVAAYVGRLLDRGGVAPTPARRRAVIGIASDGSPVSVPTSGTLLVSGDPRSGKSWLAGLVAEQLVEAGYRLCVVDPEGDHAALGRRPGVVVLGQDVPLPAPDAVPAVLNAMGATLVLALERLPQAEKSRWVASLLASLPAERRRSGFPHWLFVDEAHYFFRTEESAAALLDGTGSVALITYRPSLLPTAVHAAVATHLVTRTAVEEERYVVDGLLRTRGPAGLVPAEALAELTMPLAGMLETTPDGPRWQIFEPMPRRSPHAHHERKYADTRLPPECAFRFRDPRNGVVRVAGNVREFCDAVAEIPTASLHHHLLAGDFSRWARDVLGDASLARGLAKLERTTAAGAPPSREEVLDHVRDRYVT